MTKEEFLYELKKELSVLDSAEATAYNLRYYSDYIDAEIAKGRSEQEVLDELGNPRWLVNSIKESGDYGRVQDIIDGPLENIRSNDEDDQKMHTIRIEGMKARILGVAILAIFLLFLVAIFYILGKIFVFLLPVLIPILLICLIFGFMKILDR
jgi:hypothetical protein